jgi:hypothetical protein
MPFLPTRPRTLVYTAVAINVGAGVLIAALQIWSHSQATLTVIVSRAAFDLIMCLPLLLHRRWGRWTAAFVGVVSSGWLIYSAITAHVLGTIASVLIGACGIVTLCAALVPWHPHARDYFIE